MKENCTSVPGVEGVCQSGEGEANGESIVNVCDVFREESEDIVIRHFQSEVS